MAKLPTTFTSLDLTGFEIEKTNYREVTGSMVETTCAVLQKNRVGIVVRSVQAGLKSIYGIGGSADKVFSISNPVKSRLVNVVGNFPIVCTYFFYSNITYLHKNVNMFIERNY